MVKFGRVSRARPSGRRVWGGLLSGLENRGHEGSVYVRFWGAVSGAVEAVWDARWQVFGHAGGRSWARGGRSPSAAS